MRITVIIALLTVPFSTVDTMAQTVEQRALIGRLQQGNTP